MRWNDHYWDWKRKFAWLPINVGRKWIWWEPYLQKHCGEYIAVKLAHRRNK